LTLLPLPIIKSFKPKSVKICALIDKRTSETDCKVDYACHTVEGGFWWDMDWIMLKNTGICRHLSPKIIISEESK
jgi:hypoxanthine-guanine phosphoribosyltransferase